MSESTVKNNSGALGTLVTVFFFWGFIGAGNGVFIPFCRDYFHLDQFQSQLVDYAFYVAYYVGALLLYIFGTLGGKDLVGSWGYKKSIIYGLLFSAIGGVAMVIAVKSGVFYGVLTGLFIMALGFSLQQTAANPFAISLGDPKTGTNRINLGGGVNSFGTMIGPIIISLLLFGSAAASDTQKKALDISSVTSLYFGVIFLFIGAAALFGFSKKVPAGINEEKVEKSNKALTSLLVITGLLIITFVPVFSSYVSAEQKQIEANEKIIGDKKTAAQLAFRSNLNLQGKDTTMANEFFKQPAKVILSKIDSISGLAVSNTNAANAAKNLKEANSFITNKTAENQALKKPLEHSRMIWLLAALAVVIGGLLFSNLIAQKSSDGWGAMKYPQLVLGMLAIFTYVGVEVTIQSNLGELLKLDYMGGIESSKVAPYISLYWGSLMIGRWMGSVSVFNFTKQTNSIMLVVVPIIAFILTIVCNTVAGSNMQPLYWFIICVLIQIAGYIFGQDKPTKTLLIFSILGVISMLVGLFTTGTIATYAFLSGGLWCSIMWPSIFSLAIAGIGKYTTQGSAFLVMMILGGGIIPPLQGKLADIIGIHESYWIPVVCFGYLALFAVLVKGILTRQGVNYDASTGGGH